MALVRYSLWKGVTGIFLYMEGSLHVVIAPSAKSMHIKDVV